MLLLCAARVQPQPLPESTSPRGKVLAMTSSATPGPAADLLPGPTPAPTQGPTPIPTRANTCHTQPNLQLNYATNARSPIPDPAARACRRGAQPVRPPRPASLSTDGGGRVVLSHEKETHVWAALSSSYSSFSFCWAAGSSAVGPHPWWPAARGRTSCSRYVPCLHPCQDADRRRC